MAITRERKPDYSGRQAGRRRDPCAGERSDYGVRDFYREYAGRGWLKEESRENIIKDPEAALSQKKRSCRAKRPGSRATPRNSARSLSQNFCPNSKFQKWRNTVCISHFWDCGSGVKRRLRLEDAIARCCPKDFNWSSV